MGMRRSGEQIGNAIRSERSVANSYCKRSPVTIAYHRFPCRSGGVWMAGAGTDPPFEKSYAHSSQNRPCRGVSQLGQNAEMAEAPRRCC